MEANPTTAIALSPVYAPAPPIARTVLSYESAVTLVALTSVASGDEVGMVDADAPPSTATADCPSPLAFANSVELHDPISTPISVTRA